MAVKENYLWPYLVSPFDDHINCDDHGEAKNGCDEYGRHIGKNVGRPSIVVVRRVDFLKKRKK